MTQFCTDSWDKYNPGSKSWLDWPPEWRVVWFRAGRVRELSGTISTEMNGGICPRCHELFWTNFPDQLVSRELNYTELISNKFELWTRRPCKFTNRSDPGLVCVTFLKTHGLPPIWRIFNADHNKLIENYIFFKKKYLMPACIRGQIIT